MKLIKFHSPYVHVELEVNVHSWKDAALLSAIVVVVLGLIVWLIMN